MYWAWLPQVEGGSRGIYSTRPITPYDLLVSVPVGRTLSVAPSQACPFPETIDGSFWAGAQWYTRLALLLLREKLQGSQSVMAPYLQVLPTSADLPANWTPEELLELQYPYLITRVGPMGLQA
jgi:hypothetical protein